MAFMTRVKVGTKSDDLLDEARCEEFPQDYGVVRVAKPKKAGEVRTFATFLSSVREKRLTVLYLGQS
jgi:hypothetical protein